MVAEKCPIHDEFELRRAERWAEQEKKNQALFTMCGEITKAVDSLNKRTAYATGAITVVVMLAPFIWKLAALIMGVKI